jgi:hypothetical protein
MVIKVKAKPYLFKGPSVLQENNKKKFGDHHGVSITACIRHG